MSSSTAPFGMYSHSWLFTYPLVWAIALSNSKGNARSLINRIKQIIVPTPSFCFTAFIWELGSKLLL